jgi:hypothetical protein
MIWQAHILDARDATDPGREWILAEVIRTQATRPVVQRGGKRLPADARSASDRIPGDPQRLHPFHGEDQAR